MKKRIVRLTESQLNKIVKTVLNESYSGGIIQRGDDICEIICKRKLAMYGSNGDVVKMIQHLLYVNQYNTKYSGGGMNGDWCYSDWTKCDGVFKNQTQTAVEEFQSKNGLTVDGKVGYSTWKAMCESKIFIFSKSLPKNVFCKVCNCKDKEEWARGKDKRDGTLPDDLDDFIIDPIKIIDTIDCKNLKDCVKKHILGRPSVDRPSVDYKGFESCLRGGKDGSGKNLSCDTCKRNFPEGFIDKMPKVVYDGTNPYTMSAEEIKQLEVLGDWCIKNCDGYKVVY
jgi:hypothetical protein